MKMRERLTELQQFSIGLVGISEAGWVAFGRTSQETGSTSAIVSVKLM